VGECAGSILRDGLRTDPDANGILNPYPTEQRLHWVDAFYGMRPVFLLTGPIVHETYYWEWGENDARETPVLLKSCARAEKPETVPTTGLHER
jgi:hypothetical protein